MCVCKKTIRCTTNNACFSSKCYYLIHFMSTLGWFTNISEIFAVRSSPALSAGKRPNGDWGQPHACKATLQGFPELWIATPSIGSYTCLWKHHIWRDMKELSSALLFQTDLYHPDNQCWLWSSAFCCCLFPAVWNASTNFACKLKCVQFLIMKTCEC